MSPTYKYRKVPNRRRASIKFFEFRVRFYSKISLQSFFCALLFKPRLYLNRASIWIFTVYEHTPATPATPTTLSIKVVIVVLY